MHHVEQVAIRLTQLKVFVAPTLQADHICQLGNLRLGISQLGYVQTEVSYLQYSSQSIGHVQDRISLDVT